MTGAELLAAWEAHKKHKAEAQRQWEKARSLLAHACLLLMLFFFPLPRMLLEGCQASMGISSRLFSRHAVSCLREWCEVCR